MVARKTYSVDYDWPTLIGCVGVSSALVFLAQWGQESLELWQRLTVAVVASVAYPAITIGFLLRSEHERTRVLQYLSLLKMPGAISERGSRQDESR